MSGGRVAKVTAGASILQWLRVNLFASLPNAMVTFAIGWLLWMIVAGLLDWALFRAIWSAGDGTLCRQTPGAGACWAFIADKHRFILFGTYPYDQHWRPASAVAILLALYAVSTLRSQWRPRLALVWCAGLTAIGILMWGGVVGLPRVESERWGGLILTLLLSTFGIACAFPLAILLALGRRSSIPVLRLFSVVYIELVRGVPLISVLFMASLMVPLFLPSGVSVDKLLRAQVALILFAAAYLAEVIRGGLQALPGGQDEAAQALGLTYWQRHWFVILPQALRIAIPPMVNTFIGFFKDTSLVVIIGLFDLLTTIKISLNEPAWTGFGLEAYTFAAVVYFMFCYPMSQYSQRLERSLAHRPAVRVE
jgi:general L-amino acid transport system permease protein